jgi:glycosyltransferase involved in cell wall biosynthesis
MPSGSSLHAARPHASPPPPPLVSTVIPTYNRRDDVILAIRSALAQSHPAQQIIVIDDGSTDNTTQRLVELHGNKLELLRTNRLGVAGARNRGMAAARGEYIAFLDSDDDWTPDKLARQVAFLEERPDFGIVVTDVVQMDRDRREYDILRRRQAIPEDGNVLHHVLRFPTLAPSSALLRRKVYEELGGFDTSLPTAEDIDFLLRAALRFKIGVIDEPLTRAMRGHDGLSALGRTYTDYLYVMERYLLDHRHEIPPDERRAALWEAYLRNMRGLLVTGRLRDGLGVGMRLAARTRTSEELKRSASMVPLLLRVTARKVLRRNKPPDVAT